MDEKTKKKRSKIDISDLGSSFDRDPNKGKKKERKKEQAPDKILNSNEALVGNCTGEAIDNQTCPIEGNIILMGNKEDENHENKRKKKNRNVIDDEVVQFLDDNQECNIKKRKKYDCSLKCNNGEHSDQIKHMKKKKLGEENQPEECIEFKGNELKNGHQDKKMKKEKKLSEKGKIVEFDEFKTNKVEADHQGKQKKKKKKSVEESQHKENIGNGHKDDYQDKMKMKEKKNKLCDKSKSKENSKFNSNEGDPPLVRVTEVDDQGKKTKLKKKDKECNEFKGNELKNGDQDKMKKEKKLSEEAKTIGFNEFKTNEVEADHQGKQKKKKKKSVEESQHKENIDNGHKDDCQDKMKTKEKKNKLCDKSKSKENSKFNRNEGDPSLVRVTEVDDQGKKTKLKKKDKAGSGESSNPGSSKSKRVTFSDQVDICCDGLVRGKWFTREEDEKVKAAVYDYIESHGLGDEGLDMILHCKSHPEVKNCWKEIGAALPDRPCYSVYHRAHILFERDDKRKWTPEELDFLRKVQEKHGSDWKSVAEALGKHRFHVKDTWRRIKLANRNKGRWTQEEYQKLFDLVNLDLRERASEGYRKSKHGMLRDNIGWEAIGDKLATRASANCCKKWYDHLTSPMVANGDWADADDYRLINALFTLDACSMAEVDWDSLLEHRDGDVCRKRWNQMVRYIGEHGGKPFAEQVEILAKRFCPDLMEVREAYEEKPMVC